MGIVKKIVGIIVAILIFLLALGYIQKRAVPEYNSLYNLGDLTTYKINPETILESLKHGEKDIFEFIPPRPDEDIVQIFPAGSFAWNQEDYLLIANALHQIVWQESLEGWQIILARYEVQQCQDMKEGFDTALYYFYKPKEDQYVVHGLWITPIYGEVDVNENYYSYTGDWKSVELEKLQVSNAGNALLIAEQNGGTQARATSQKGCYRVDVYLEPDVKYNLVSHPFNLYDWGWKICYYLDDFLCMKVDPYTGKGY
jgi:hypothetical protein